MSHKTTLLCMTGMLTAVIVILSQISVPMPLGVPMTMHTFAITLAAVILGSRYGSIAVLIYLFLGMIGLPVFANFNGGLSCLVGPTGGFLISFPIMAFLIGLGVEYRRLFPGALALFVTLGTIVNLLIGMIMFCLLSGSPASLGFSACVLPFVPSSVIKEAAGVTIGLSIRKRLSSIEGWKDAPRHSSHS